MLSEFLAFLKEYKVVSLSIAFVMGSASTALVKSLVDDVIMPIFAPVLSDDKAWRQATLDFGPVHIAYGSFIAQALNFVIVAFIVYLIARKLFKLDQQEEAAKG